MPRRSIEEAVESYLDATGADRLVDLRADLLAESTGDVLFTAGGVWDRRDKTFSGAAPKSKLLRLHDGQLEVGRFFSAWLAAQREGQILTQPDGRRVWSVALVGGRRGGKTDIALKLAVLFAVMIPRSITWIVLPTYPDGPEVERELEALLPKHWYEKVGRPTWCYTFVSGSQIFLKSSDDPEDVKKGRCDLAIVNEAQKQEENAFSILRPAIADRGGLVVLTANPPKRARGQWVAEYVANAEAGVRIDEKGERQPFMGKVFRLDPRRNPHIKNAALLDMKGELSDREFRIEILGEFLPSPDVVMHAWSDFNRRPVPELGDMTFEFSRRVLGIGFEHLIGMDFQRSPHMAAACARVFADPLDAQESLLWYDNEVVVENGDEDDLIDALEKKGYNPKTTALVVDASGEWQDADRTRGRASCDMLRKRGWRNIYLPDGARKKNPPIEERCAIANARMRTRDGKIHVYLDPRCQRTDEALRKWETKSGRPLRTSKFAHLCDAVTYLIHRLYPRRDTDAKLEHYHGTRPELSGNWSTINGRSLFDSNSRDDDAD